MSDNRLIISTSSNRESDPDGPSPLEAFYADLDEAKAMLKQAVPDAMVGLRATIDELRRRVPAGGDGPDRRASVDFYAWEDVISGDNVDTYNHVLDELIAKRFTWVGHAAPDLALRVHFRQSGIPAHTSAAKYYFRQVWEASTKSILSTSEGARIL